MNNKIKLASFSNCSEKYEEESSESLSENKNESSKGEQDAISYMNMSDIRNDKLESSITNSNNFENIRDSGFSDSYDFTGLKSNKDTEKKHDPFSKYFGKEFSKHLRNITKDSKSSNSFIDNLLKNAPPSFLNGKKKGHWEHSSLNNANTSKSDNFPTTVNNINMLNLGDIGGGNSLKKYGFNSHKNNATATTNNNNNNVKYAGHHEDNYYSNGAFKNIDESSSINDKRSIEKGFNDPSDFENMVSDLRVTFINWLKKTQLNFIREKDKLMKDRKELEMEKMKMYNELEEKKMLEEARMQEERKKLDIDITNGYKQLKKEKEENRKRFDEERLRFLHEIDKMKIVLNMEKEKYYQEYKNFEIEKKKIVDANIATETLIDINIGGVVFETSRHTLTQQKNSFLEQLLSGRHKVARDKNGKIFLDRDSELFRIILNFLRNPLNIPVPKDLNESEALLKETEYYGINFLPFPLAFSVGGFDGVDYLQSVELLDISRQCWRMCTPMATKKAYFGSAVLNNFLYVFGGNNYDYKALFETEVYDRLRDVWFLASNLNIPRRNNSGVTLNGRIYSIGGYDGTSIIPNVEAYDHRMKAWVEVAPLNVPRSSTMSVAMDNKIYVIGGTNGERLKSIEVYDEKMNVWEKFPHDLLEARSAGSAFAYLNQIYVMGGIDNEHNVLNSVEQYQFYNKRWQFLSSIPENKMNFAAATLSDSYIITGGENGGVLNSCYFFSPDTNEWQIGPPLLVPRFGHAVLIANL